MRRIAALALLVAVPASAGHKPWYAGTVGTGAGVCSNCVPGPPTIVAAADLPQRSGTSQLGVWAAGEPRVVKDNGGAGELLTFGANPPGTLHLVKSSDNGQSWSWASGSESTTVTDTVNAGAGVLSVAQSSDGKVHLLYKNTAQAAIQYWRLVLTRSSGAITGFTTDAGPITVPGGYDLSNGGYGGPGFPTGGDVRGTIRVVTNGSGTEVLVTGICDGGGTTTFRLQMTMTASTNPTAGADFTKLDGTAGASLVISDATTSLHCHDHVALFAQLGSSRDLYVFYGNTVAEQTATTPTSIQRVRLTASGATWTSGGLVSTYASSSYLYSVAGTSSYVWAQYLDTATGSVRFGRVDSSGTYTDQPISSPFSVGAQGWGLGVIQAADDGTVRTIFVASPFAGGGFVWAFVPRYWYWNGSTWTNVGTGGTDLGDGVGNIWGMAGSTGWAGGLVGLYVHGPGSSAVDLLAATTLRP